MSTPQSVTTQSAGAPPLSAPAASLTPPPDRELLRARLFLRAALPVTRVMLEDDPATKKRFEGVRATVQFVAKNKPEPIGAYLVFGDLAPTGSAAAPASGVAASAAAAPIPVRTVQGFADKADVTFSFGSVTKLNDFFAGKTVLPSIKGLSKPGLVAKVVQLLLSLKLMMPSAQPTDPDKRRLKLKLTLYMITTALSQYNKGGDPEMASWTSKQPERIYQLSVEPEGIAAYLRIRGGQSKAGRGIYERRRPFVHLRFHGVDGALAVMNKEVGFIEGVAKGYVRVEGSPEYAANFSDYMLRVQGLLTG
jgi:hypothetical protein